LSWLSSKNDVNLLSLEGRALTRVSSDQVGSTSGFINIKFHWESSKITKVMTK